MRAGQPVKAGAINVKLFENGDTPGPGREQRRLGGDHVVVGEAAARETFANENDGARVLALGTGSGAIALALALLRPQLDVVAVDRSPDALAVAKRNLGRLLPGTQRVHLVRGDWYQALSGGAFDLIVSNPPYVAARDPHLGEGDLRFEPAAALVGGDDGLDAIRRVVAGAAAFLAPGGQLLFEHGYDQAPVCRRLLAAAGFSSLIEVADLAGIPRVAGGRLLGGMAS